MLRVLRSDKVTRLAVVFGDVGSLKVKGRLPFARIIRERRSLRIKLGRREAIVSVWPTALVVVRLVVSCMVVPVAGWAIGRDEMTVK